ncbi:MAG TPA: TetR family transcriptional regulator [Galbitalea sp.]|nr:TetR family transcriptional regulator [Galbitalea sp.]
MTDSSGDWRAAKKLATRARIRAAALKLFGEIGYDAATVERIADAASVTHTTFFRYFPTKEDVALSDDYDPLIAELIRTRPANESDAQKIRTAFVSGLETIDSEFRDGLLAQMRLVLVTPALRARLWEEQAQTQRLVLDALGTDTFEARTVSSALIAAASVAILAWAEAGGVDSLAGMVDRAFAALEAE